ncbi:MAG: DEAD/DEAH box helicase, partial [Proteobacteria bacterium]|nr:DEAD/DEAH box helicase [Pseudomonadota bacterium]
MRGKKKRNHSSRRDIPHKNFPLQRLFSSHQKRSAAWATTEKEIALDSKKSQQLIDLTLTHTGVLDLSLDPWQAEALGLLKKGHHVVIDAPTTAGKTRVVEAYLRECIRGLSASFQSCYTCPVKSLANDKYTEMKELFGPEYVGISTGDNKINLQAPIIIATLESYRNSLLGIDSPLTTDLVIFDEYHYIQDYSRGSSWQEAIILSDKKSQLLLLSASVANPEDFVHWIGRIHPKKAKVIQTTHRPVPLANLIFDG